MPTARAVHQAARAAYDAVAPRYADLYDDGRNSLMAHYRAANLRCLESFLPAGAHLLEIGSGSGEEAAWLAARGRRVTAVDISLGLLDLLRVRCEREGVTDRVALAAAAASALPFADGSFDGAYASFGALNTEPDLFATAAALYRLLKPNGPLVVSVINRWCAWESGWYLAHGQVGLAARRWTGVWQRASVGPGALAWSRALSAADVARQFAPWFQVEAMHGVGVALPPTYLHGVVACRPRLLAALSRVDAALAHRWPFRLLGDHVRLLLRRSALPTPHPGAQQSAARGH